MLQQVKSIITTITLGRLSGANMLVFVVLFMWFDLLCIYIIINIQKYILWLCINLNCSRAHSDIIVCDRLDRSCGFDNSNQNRYFLDTFFKRIAVESDTHTYTHTKRDKTKTT